MVDEEQLQSGNSRWLKLPLAILAGLVVAASTQVLIQGIAIALYPAEQGLGYTLVTLIGIWLASFVGVLTALLLERRCAAVLSWSLVAILALVAVLYSALLAYPWWLALAAIAGMLPLSRLAGRMAV